MGEGRIEVDGSYGEGGGQVLRGAVALACLTGRGLRIFNIRAGRPKPGLQPQHLASIQAAAEVSAGRLSNAWVGSTEIGFTPGRAAGGSYTIDIKTAGSVTLVVQTLLPILLSADRPSEVRILGGTDVPWSPPIDYVRQVFIPGLRAVGVCGVSLELVRRGHYPKGGGEAVLRVEPSRGLRGMVERERGAVGAIRGVSYCTNLPAHVARRQADSAERALREAGFGDVRVSEEAQNTGGSPGSGVVLWAETGGRLRIGADALGAREKRAEAVGAEAARGLVAELGSGMAADSHMADMLTVYLAAARGQSEVGVASLTRHAETMMWLTKEFLGTEWHVLRATTGSAVVKVDGSALLG